MSNLIPQTVIDALAAKGWIGGVCVLGPTVWYAAAKMYPTAVGDRRAAIYIRDDGRLSGEYRSEGNNVLEACTGTAAELEPFLLQVEAKINATYARRLLAV